MGKVREAMGGDAIEIQDGGVIVLRSGARLVLDSGAVNRSQRFYRVRLN